MKTTTPEISWHSCCALYSVDFCSKLHQNIQSNGQSYFIMATGSVDSLVGIWLISSTPTKGKDSIIFLSYLEKHVGGVNVVRFSPCGNYLATGGDDGNLMIWEINTDISVNVDQMETITNFVDMWTFKYCLRGHIDAIYDICWSHDSTMLCSGSIDNNCILWSLEKRKYVHIFSDNKSYVQGLAWSPIKIAYKNKSHVILCHCADGLAKIYDVSTKKLAKKISRYFEISTPLKNESNNDDSKKVNNFQIFCDDLHGSFYRRCAFSPDGHYFILTSGIISSSLKPHLYNAAAAAANNNNSNKSIRVAFLYSTILPTTPLTYYTSSDNTSCIAVKFSPKVYKLRENVAKVNQFTHHLTYRMLFALLSIDTLVIYDTQALDPIGFVKNTHLSSHTDIAWFPDGNGLVFTSTDGYCTVCEFSPSEIGVEVDLILGDEELLNNDINNNELLKNDEQSEELKNNEGLEKTAVKVEPDKVHFFKSEQINVRISNSCPEDIKTPIDVNETKPKRVSFITLSKPSE